MGHVQVTSKMTAQAIQGKTEWTNADLSNTLLTVGKREVKDSGHLWRLTCAMVLRNQDMLASDNLDDFMEQFGELLAMQTEHEDVPIATKGKNAGKPAWRSWSVTKPRWQYANYIFNAMDACGGVDEVFPKDKPLPSLADVRKMGSKKAKETPLQTIKRSLELVSKKIPEVKAEDLQEINNLVSSLAVEAATALHNSTK